jgi:hypothetical protein
MREGHRAGAAVEIEADKRQQHAPEFLSQAFEILFCTLRLLQL